MAEPEATSIVGVDAKPGDKRKLSPDAGGPATQEQQANAVKKLKESKSQPGEWPTAVGSVDAACVCRN